MLHRVSVQHGQDNDIVWLMMFAHTHTLFLPPHAHTSPTLEISQESRVAVAKSYENPRENQLTRREIQKVSMRFATARLYRVLSLLCVARVTNSAVTTATTDTTA